MSSDHENPSFSNQVDPRVRCDLRFALPSLLDLDVNVIPSVENVQPPVTKRKYVNASGLKLFLLKGSRNNEKQVHGMSTAIASSGNNGMNDTGRMMITTQAGDDPNDVLFAQRKYALTNQVTTTAIFANAGVGQRLGSATNANQSLYGQGFTGNPSNQAPANSRQTQALNVNDTRSRLLPMLRSAPLQLSVRELAAHFRVSSKSQQCSSRQTFVGGLG